jgi:ketosteroid isomerase-like protein
MDDLTELRATVKAWTDARFIRDWDGVLALCTDDVVFSPPGEPSVSGDAIRSWLELLPPVDNLTMTVEKADIAGDSATATGTGGWSAHIEGQLITMEFKYMATFKKRGADGWAFSHVMWNMNHALI